MKLLQNAMIELFPCKSMNSSLQIDDRCYVVCPRTRGRSGITSFFSLIQFRLVASQLSTILRHGISLVPSLLNLEITHGPAHFLGNFQRSVRPLPSTTASCVATPTLSICGYIVFVGASASAIGRVIACVSVWKNAETSADRSLITVSAT